jgi:hypothetical protein
MLPVLKMTVFGKDVYNVKYDLTKCF